MYQPPTSEANAAIKRAADFCGHHNKATVTSWNKDRRRGATDKGASSNGLYVGYVVGESDLPGGLHVPLERASQTVCLQTEFRILTQKRLLGIYIKTLPLMSITCKKPRVGFRYRWSRQLPGVSQLKGIIFTKKCFNRVMLFTF